MKYPRTTIINHTEIFNIKMFYDEFLVDFKGMNIKTSCIVMYKLTEKKNSIWCFSIENTQILSDSFINFLMQSLNFRTLLQKQIFEYCLS